MAQLVNQPTDLNGPAYYPPAGIEPKLDGKSDGMIYNYTLLPVLGILGTAFLALRIYTKARVVRKFNAPDYLLLLCYPLYIATLVVGGLVIKNGAGSHQWNVILRDYITMYYWINTAEAMWNVSMFLVKAAIVLQYVDMLAPNQTVNPAMWWSSRVLIGIMFGFYTGGLFSGLFICTPRSSIWNVLEKGKCNNEARLVLITALFNIVSDMVILLLPVRSVWKMRIAAQKKTAIIVLFCTGFSACAAALIRIYYMVVLSNQGDDPDLTYSIIWVGMWSCIEIMLGIMIASSLVLPKFFRFHDVHITSFLNKFSRPSRTFKPSFVKSRTAESEESKKKKKNGEKNFALTFNQGKAFGTSFRASRIELEGEERDVEMGVMGTTSGPETLATVSGQPGTQVPEKKSEPVVVVEEENESKEQSKPASWMDVQFDTGSYLLDGRSIPGSSGSSTRPL
ncbi:hypothetical protein CC80DRAFT_449694 [Byssothecium circinans]|uniref:Rhodopsin domain-containing protein n=1 Tax=Byssothecium circinans TaxID=147558 RepID=A0A6A5TN65_9PLEO|nr:hypothetical protein CC80DRAFT_449694 [Byssothecium circinans]